jgi:hypothetical protein
MVATFDVEVDFGVTPTMESLTNLRFNSADDNVQDTSDPIEILGSTNYSYWKHVYLRCTGGTFTQCNNFQYYQDGVGYDTGITIMVANDAMANSGDYDQADGNNEMVANHANVTGSTDIATYTSGGSKKSFGVVPGDSIIDAATEETDYLVFQMNVANTASPGQVTSKTHTVQYDEI